MPLNRNEIFENIRNGRSFTVSFRYADNETIKIINGIYVKLLARYDLLYTVNSIITIMREVVANAEKANAKRVYFINNGLDIRDPEDYDKGMKNFRDHVVTDREYYEKFLSGSDLTVSINFDISDDGLAITVSNDVGIIPEEQERINRRIESSYRYGNIMEAFENIIDTTEGAGLGIALTIVTLKHIGIDPSLFTITGSGSRTEVKLTVPAMIKPSGITTKIKEEIINRVEGIPTFPENTTRLLGMCDDPETSLETIAGETARDPALSADLLKLANSAGFISGKKVENIYGAVKNLGLQNVKSLLMASRARQILQQRYDKFEEIWDHCNRVAFYGKMIGKKYFGKRVAEKASLAGLLHDLGKIILLSTDENVTMKVAGQMKNRKIITATFLEEISIGISHPTIGGLLSEKWNFPGYLIGAVRLHHSPLEADPENRDTVETVYLANLMSGIETRKYTWYDCYESVLERFSLSERAAFEQYHEELKKKWEGAAGAATE